MDKSESRILNYLQILLWSSIFWLVVFYGVGWLHNYLSYI
jgi:hypothetical protein